MNLLKMRLTGDNSVGWTWQVAVDGQVFVLTQPLDGNDLGEAMFSIGRDRSRENPYFHDVSDDDLFVILDGFFNGRLYDALRASAEEQIWARHLIYPATPKIVSSRMYLIGGGGGPDRLLVSRAGVRYNFRIEAGSFDRALHEIIERLNAAIDSSPGAT